jgi:succinyl-CoA synthetase beta subunit
MRLHEYQSKEIISRTGIQVPAGMTVSTPEEAGAAFERLGSPLAVVKAQVHAGGRGKAGGIKTARSAKEAVEAAASMFGRRFVTHQTGADGLIVRKVLVEEGLAVEHEYYVAITIDREKSMPVVIASASGGMDIEDVARTSPEKIIKEYIEPVFGLQPFQARNIAYRLGVGREHVADFVNLLLKLHIVFLVSDAELVEVNPLVKVESDEFVALDAKIVIDDNGMFRHDDLKKYIDISDLDPLELKAREAGVNYIKLKGNIGCMVNGAGLAMATMDLIKNIGGEPANFLDVGGGADAEKITAALRVLVADPQVQSVMVNIFGGILRCDVLAKGIVAAAKDVRPDVPIIVRLEGTNRDEGERILKESGLGIIFADSMREAGELAVGRIKSDA